MAPQPNQVFYIASQALTVYGVPPEPPYVLGVEGNNTQPGARIILYPSERSDAQSQL
ncbi:MAG: hypothetical protein HOU01_26735, partial [Streptomycetaceae bacterium]|nr:hypothetical protein [Streptomycetaceae bacterium]